jgi:hypothetical protein
MALFMRRPKSSPRIEYCVVIQVNNRASWDSESFNDDFVYPVKATPASRVRSVELPEHPPLEFHFQYANKGGRAIPFRNAKLFTFADLLAAHDIIPYSKPPQPIEKKPTKKRRRESEVVKPNDEDGLSKDEAETLRRLQVSPHMV